MSFQTFEKSSPPPVPRTLESMSQTQGSTTGFRPASDCWAPARPTAGNNPSTNNIQNPNSTARRNLAASFDQVDQPDQVGQQK